MARVSFTAIRPVAEVDPMWRDVAQGKGPADWPDQIPTDVRVATSDMLPRPARDVTISVTMQDEATILFTASARTA
jgi:hypothetical protein